MSDSDQQSDKQDDNKVVGKTIGQFLVLEEIGRGGMATVYRATQQSINRDVALKVLPRAFLHDPGFFERFEREVDVIAHLEHPHIVPIYDYGEADGMPYIAMRYLAGGSLRRLIRDNLRDLKDLVRPVSQIAQALDHAHAQGIIHRDLKPGNILLDKTDNAYLSDFGIARVLNSDLTGSAIIGTPSYMSPEQANGETLDARSDVYALGIVVFELITGREPFQAATPIAMLLKQINERIPSLTEYRDNIPEAVDRVIARSTEKNREDRYSSAGEMAEAFEDAVRNAGNISLPVSPVTSRDELETEPDGKHVATVPMFSGPAAREKTPPPIPADNLESATVMPGTDNNITREQTALPDGPETAYATPPPYRPPARKRTPRRPIGLILGGAVALVATIAGVVFLMSAFRGAPSLTDTVPLYAEDLSIVVNDDYAVALPGDLTMASDGVWVNADETVRLSFALFTVGEDASLEEAGTAQIATTDGDLIEDIPLPGGQRRQSYRQPATDTAPAGQLDVYFARAGTRLMIVETFSADAIGNDYNETFQNILNAVRLAAPSRAG